MKNLKFALALVLALTLGVASAGVPEKHEEYMKDEDYKNAFEQFTMGMEGAKDSLTPDEYKALEKEGEEVIAAAVKADMESDTSEPDAYVGAYWMRYEQISTELRWDWLRKNAEDAQGFYSLKSDAFDGYMTLEKGEEEGEYAVAIFATMKRGPHNTGDFEGPGKLSGSEMAVTDFDDMTVMIITFDGETAKVQETQDFKDSGWLGAGVTLDGEYVREKK
jgi:hypothetical protein